MFTVKTSKLQERVSEFLSVHFGEYTIRENHAPDWLITPDGGRCQLDFYITELDKAIEVQGIQHFKYIPYFHGTPDGFERRQYLDSFKREVCERRGTQLVEVCDEADVMNLLELKPAAQEKPFVPTDMHAVKVAYINARDTERSRVRVTDRTKRVHFIMQMIVNGTWSQAERVVLSSWAIKCTVEIKMSADDITAIQRQYGVNLMDGHQEYVGEFRNQLTECSKRLRPIVFGDMPKQKRIFSP